MIKEIIKAIRYIKRTEYSKSMKIKNSYVCKVHHEAIGTTGPVDDKSWIEAVKHFLKEHKDCFKKPYENNKRKSA